VAEIGSQAIRQVSEQATVGLDSAEGLAIVGASTSSDMIVGEMAFRQVLFEEPLDKPEVRSARQGLSGTSATRAT